MYKIIELAGTTLFVFVCVELIIVSVAATYMALHSIYKAYKHSGD